MEITTRNIRNCQILDLNGKLFLGPATRDLRNTFNEAVKKNPKKIVVGMKNVTHIDTPGLGELIDCHAHAQKLGMNLVLLNPRERLMHLLIVTKMKTVFDIFHDESLAVAAPVQSTIVS